MTKSRGSKFKLLAISGAAALAIATAAQAAEPSRFDVAGGDLKTALVEFAGQSSQEILFSSDIVAGRRTAGVSAEADAPTALAQLLTGTGLTYRQTDTGTLLVVRADQAPQGGSAAGGGATVEALIVTAQKREEDIQDVPIAISAFSQKQLDAQKIEGGFDLLKAIPNVSFTKTNFTSYNFQIRGIGTQSISATSDPGVAVAFNNTGIIQNRLFEQEYLDVERVEVLRGPQGTLYGRNATAGVINVISAKPRLGRWEGDIKAELGNYDATRMRGMINVPIGETLAIRLAAAGTIRDGYTFNSGTGRPVDGRNLWTGRLSVGWEPTPNIRANLIWERFQEDDDRLRTGKQLCHRDDGPTMVGSTVLDGSVVGPAVPRTDVLRAIFSQGCKPGGLFDDGAYGTPNGLSLNFINPIVVLSKNGIPVGSTAVGTLPGTIVTSGGQAIIQAIDPYGGKRQSRDLREIQSIRDPVYRAKADLLELNIDFDLTDDLTFYSQTAYNNDETYSFQDFNRFNTEPIFTNTDTDALDPVFGNDFSDLAPGGVFCDPQIGCSDRIAGFDIAQASAEQFSQEFRLQSSFAAPVNFSVGANYTGFNTTIDYYVMYNVLTALAWSIPLSPPGGVLSPGVFERGVCGSNDFWQGNPFLGGPSMPVPADDPNASCPYVDLNPVDTSKQFEGDGHNYFRSKNPYKLKSWAAFGELYWNIRDDLKVTAGLRYTDDKKVFTLVPTQLLLAKSAIAGGYVSKGYPEKGKVKQQWGEMTGRLVVDWKPVLDFTNETLLYAAYSRGYKGGGANPPLPGFATPDEINAIQAEQGTPQSTVDQANALNLWPVLSTAGGYGQTFDPEFVNAYELGAKNTLLNGGMTFNVTAFYYDYKDYQVSQIRDRTAVNENFDAEMWGIEFETMFAPSRNFQIIANLGYLDTKIGDGETSIDIMNRTQGDPNYVIAKPWAQLPSNCVVPTQVVESWLNSPPPASGPFILCGVGGALGLAASFSPIIDPETSQPYDPANYPEINGGLGLVADVGGNQLPNSPHWTLNIGGQYGFDLAGDWRLVVRGDAYWQSQSYHRIYNTEPYDKLHGWYNANLVIWAENEELGLHIEGYVKNLLNNDPITGAFLNSDDTGLTTNVFMLDPRLYGISVRKSF